MSEHSEEQGLRVHHLVNLGGLIAIAGLDREPPDFLLGALVSVAHERDAADAPNSGRGWPRSGGKNSTSGRPPSGRGSRGGVPQDLHSLMLNSAQMRRLIAALGGDGAGRSGAAGDALTELLEEQADDAAAVETARG